MKKILVWDGDETLWDGTILDGDEPVLPKAHEEACAELYNRGVVQSVASHNLQEDVLQAIHRLGLEDYMLVPQAALGTPKSHMILQIQKLVGIAKLSDIVFLDDSPHNRAEVRQALPDVIVGTREDLPDIVAEHFTKDEYTDVDRNRVRMYRSEMARQASGEAFEGDKIAFLRTLDMKAVVRPAQSEDMPRVVDLTARANRLSAAARDYSAHDLHNLQRKIRVLEAEDKFGAYGVSGVMLADARPNSLFVSITLLVISCRLQGKGLGSTFLGSVMNGHDGFHMEAVWRGTKYNAGVKSLYEWYDFQIREHDDGLVIATKDLDEPVSLPDWIEVDYV